MQTTSLKERDFLSREILWDSTGVELAIQTGQSRTLNARYEATPAFQMCLCIRSGHMLLNAKCLQVESWTRSAMRLSSDLGREQVWSGGGSCFGAAEKPARRVVKGELDDGSITAESGA